jgi:hypothetical protein
MRTLFRFIITAATVVIIAVLSSFKNQSHHAIPTHHLFICEEECKRSTISVNHGQSRREMLVQYMKNPELFSNNTPSISCWDVSRVEDLSYLFAYTGSYWRPLSNRPYLNETIQRKFDNPLNCWNIISVKSMKGVFYGSTTFSQDLNSWDVSKVHDMSSMFNGALSFNAEIGSWDEPNVSCCEYPCVRCKLLEYLRGQRHEWNVSECRLFDRDINSWQVGNVTDMSLMFSFARDFNHNIGSWDMSSVLHINHMFWVQCLSIKIFPPGMFPGLPI